MTTSTPGPIGKARAPATRPSASTTSQLRSVGILGIGSYVPENVLSNERLEKLVDTNAQWIVERTGIHERRIAAPGQTTADLATAAGRAALESAGWEANDLDLILVGTITGDQSTSATAGQVQWGLGASRAAGFDIGLACTGFLAALATGEQFVRGGMYDKVLVIGADRGSAFTDYTDRDSCILFGDAAGAVVIGERGSDGAELLDRELMVDGSGGNLIRMRPEKARPDRESPDAPAQHSGPFLSMEGREVFRFAVKAFCERIRQVVERNGFTLEDLDWIVPHQANQRILEAGARKLGVPMDKVISNVAVRGNTSAASIPLALSEAVADGRVQKGQLVALVAFGGGLSQGVTLVRW